MTQPTQNHAPQGDSKNLIQLPTADFPLVKRVLSTPPFPPDETNKLKPDQPLLWILGEQHPIVPTRIMRMYCVLGVGVEVYSITPQGDVGVRHTIPWHAIKLVEEVMPPDVFVAELEQAEKDDDGEEEEELPEPSPEAPTLNGAPS